MNLLDPHLAHHEIDRRLRAADHHRRVRWARRTRKVPAYAVTSGSRGR